MCFNPCFSGCWSSSCNSTHIIHLSKFVSILVLVDVGLRVRYINGTDVDQHCFNPCFSGCWSSSLSCPPFTGQLTGVSILVLVDVGLRVDRTTDSQEAIREFQSLF